MEWTQIEQYHEGGYEIYRVPSIICTDKGTLIVCYECRYGGDWSAMDLVIRRSFDDGKTWTERMIIAPGYGIDVVHNGILFADGEKVHLIWHRNYREAFYMYSLDEGENWSQPRDISKAYTDLRTQYNFTSHHPSVVTTLYSDDDGKTWPYCLEVAALGGYSDIFYSPVTKRLYMIAETGRSNEETFSFGLSVGSVLTKEVAVGGNT